MADPTFYKITVNRVFVLNDVAFGPAMADGPKKGFPRYTIPADVYNGTLLDGTPFKDVCATVDPVYADEEAAA
jgi:hypothetical protein